MTASTSLRLRPLPAGFWDHQRRAVRTIRDYLADSDQDKGVALITMPTGTGKTGVIAASTALLNAPGHRLVITPWRALVGQLRDDLQGRFWNRVNHQPTNPPLVKVLPSSSRVEELSLATEPTTYITTIAAISVLARQADVLGQPLEKTFAGFDFLMVDEGHYEPAQNWSSAIRSLKLPTVLLTATPYRNDTKFFPPSTFQYRLPHHEAERELFLRKPSFELVQHTDYTHFVTAVHELTTRYFDADARVIVRCRTHHQIRDIVAVLTSIGHQAVGIHERFRPEERQANLVREVPKHDHPARFWVHQNKLIEGIDDPRFKALAFYEPLRNDRATIQQIGRVLRNPGRNPDDATALVIDNYYPSSRDSWRAYERFDQVSDTKPTSVATLPKLVEGLLAAQPDAFYYDGSYRTQVDLQSPLAWEEFVFLFRTRVFRSQGQEPPSLGDTVAAITEEWDRLDRAIFRIQHPDPATAVIPYVAAENSPLLRRATFIEQTFGYTLVRRSGEYLFLYDAGGRLPKVVKDNYKPLSSSELYPLFPADSSLTSVSLLNTDFGGQVARSRTLSAAAIDALAPDLADYAYVCSTAEGYPMLDGEKTFRRYLGLSRSRVTDHRRTDRTFESLSSWLDGLEATFRAPTNPTSTFNRYASPSEVPPDPEPVHVLLDIDSSLFWSSIGDEQVPLVINDAASEVIDGRFRMSIGDPENERILEASLEWMAEKGHYHVESSDLRGNRYLSSIDQRELVETINDDQALRVIPRTGNVIYSHGHFFKPALPSRRTEAFQLLDILHTDQRFGTATSEKGDALPNDDWDPSSAFGLISALDPATDRVAAPVMTGIFDAPDLLICTDLGTEVADFILAQEDRVAFIHAKASAQRRLYSASNLQVVASQAIKNLGYLQPTNEESPRKDYWLRDWKHPNSQQSTRRLRIGSFATPQAIWSRVRNTISDPNGEREVWLVLGNSLSKQELTTALRTRPPKPEALQAYTLLQATWSSVSQLGARLRIFCSP